MLKQPVAKYVLDPQPVYLKHAKPTASGGLAAASGSPSGPSNDASAPALEADTATQRNPSPEAAHTPRLTHAASGTAADQAELQVPYSVVQDQQHDMAQGQGISQQATPALSDFSASQPAKTPFGSNLNTPAGKPALHMFISCPKWHAVQCCVHFDSQSVASQQRAFTTLQLLGAYIMFL